MHHRITYGAALLGASLSLFSASSFAAVRGNIVTEAANGVPSQILQFSSNGTLQAAPTNNRTNVVLNPGFGEAPDLSAPQKVLVMLVGPEYQARKLEKIKALFEGAGPQSLKNFYGTQSSGALSFASFTYVSVPAPGHNGCLLAPDVQLARYSDATGDKTVNFDHVFFMGAYSNATCQPGTSAGAFANLGKIQIDNQYGSYKFTASWYPDEFLTTEFIVNHEFGHQIGWYHSNRSSATSHDEYGDSSEVMGSPFITDFRVSAVRKWAQGWQTRGVRAVRANEFGQSVTVSLTKNPELVVVPLRVTNIKPLYFGRMALALSFEDEVRTPGNPLPWRRTGVVPRLVSTGLPFMATSTLVAANPSPAQTLSDLVLDTIGTYNLPEAGVTLVVDEVTPVRINLRIFDNNVLSPVSFSGASTPANTPCYHRYFNVSGASTAFMTAQGQANGNREELKQVASGGTFGIAMFAGAGPFVANAAIQNPDESYSYYSQEFAANPTCYLVAPKLSVQQNRSGPFASDSCGMISINATNLTSPAVRINGIIPSGSVSFFGSGYFNVLGIDNRTILQSSWADDAFAIGNANIAPLDCAGSLVPKLTIAPSIANDCKTVTVKVTQSAPGVTGTNIDNMVLINGEAQQNCTTDGGLGATTCTFVYANSLNGKKLTVTSRSASDLTSVQTTLSCSNLSI
jgi:hypothetical protein